jgi:methionyl-tRNA synthetase
VLAPFLPDAAGKIRRGLGQADEPRLADARWGALRAGTTVEKVSGLFPRVEDKKPRAEPAAKKPVGADAPRITVEDFGKVELRVAEVLAAEPVPKSKKLLKLTVSLGTEERTVVAGIAEHYAPADLVGKKVVVVANLAPAKLMGVESNGMVLAGSVDGALAVLTLDRDLPPGAKVR